MITVAESLAKLCPVQLEQWQMEILSMLVDAHIVAATSNEGNASNNAALFYGTCGAPVTSALMGAMMSMGGSHAPATQAREWMFNRLGPDSAAWPEMAAADVAAGAILPGYGNSFHKTDIDPALETLAEAIAAQCPEVHARIMAGFQAVQARSAELFPNLAAYTGAVAEIIGLPVGLEPLLVFVPRLPVWAMCWLPRA
jgi:citrate synthase